MDVSGLVLEFVQRNFGSDAWGFRERGGEVMGWAENPDLEPQPPRSVICNFSGF